MKSRLLAFGQMPVLPQHVGARQRGMAAQGHLDRRREPAQAVAVARRGHGVHLGRDAFPFRLDLAGDAWIETQCGNDALAVAHHAVRPHAERNQARQPVARGVGDHVRHPVQHPDLHVAVAQQLVRADDVVVVVVAEGHHGVPDAQFPPQFLDVVQVHVAEVVEQHQPHRPGNVDQVLGVGQQALVAADQQGQRE